VQGADFADLESDTLQLAQRAWDPREPVLQGGLLKYVHGGEYHMYNPDSIHKLQYSTRSNNYKIFKEYSELINSTSSRLCTLR